MAAPGSEISNLFLKELISLNKLYRDSDQNSRPKWGYYYTRFGFLP